MCVRASVECPGRSPRMGRAKRERGEEGEGHSLTLLGSGGMCAADEVKGHLPGWQCVLLPQRTRFICSPRCAGTVSGTAVPSGQGVVCSPGRSRQLSRHCPLH